MDMTTSKHTSGAAAVTVDNGPEDCARVAPSALTNIMVRVVGRHSIEQVKIARAGWPDKGRELSPQATGKSIRGFRVRKITDPVSGVARVVILNEVKNDEGENYAYLINSRIVGTRADGRGLNAWNELVRLPMALREAQIGIDIQAEIARSFEADDLEFGP